VPHATKAIGVTEMTYYRWRQDYGGMSTAQSKRLKEPEAENNRPRTAVSDLTLDMVILRAAVKGSLKALRRKAHRWNHKRVYHVYCLRFTDR